MTKSECLRSAESTGRRVSMSEGPIRPWAKWVELDPDQDPEFSVCWRERDKLASLQSERTGQVQRSGIGVALMHWNIEDASRAMASSFSVQWFPAWHSIHGQSVIQVGTIKLFLSIKLFVSKDCISHRLCPQWGEGILCISPDGSSSGFRRDFLWKK